MQLNWFKLSYGLIIGLMSLLLIQYAVQISAGGHPWKTGDWLINYSDGLIRRGLSGSLSLMIAELTSINVKWIVYCIQSILFISFIFLVLKEFYKFKSSPQSIFLILSPAFAFIFWANDSSVAFRKELCAYLTLVFVLKAFSGNTINLVWYYVALAIYVYSGLSHEITIFVLPFLGFVIANHFCNENLNVKSIVKYYSPFVILSLLVLLVSIFFKGSQQSMELICASLSQYNLKRNFCDGAISWLQYDAKYGYERVLELGPAVWINYLLLAILSMLPMYLLHVDKLLRMATVATFMLMAPLFLIAIDYGRFISIIYTSLILVVIWTRQNLIINMAPINVWIWLAYCFIWALPNCCKSTPAKSIIINPILNLYASW